MSIGIGKGFDMLKGLQGINGGAQNASKPPKKAGQAEMALPNMLCGCQNCQQSQAFDPKQLLA